jgi:hypothetical protein
MLFAFNYFKLINLYAMSIKNTGDAYQYLGHFDKSKANYILAQAILVANYENLGPEDIYL